MVLHTALDLAGLVPALGAVPDAVNAGIYLIEGDWLNAGLSAAAIVPIFGHGVTVAKLGTRTVVRVSGEAVQRVGSRNLASGLRRARTSRSARTSVARPEPRGQGSGRASGQDPRATQHARGTGRAERGTSQVQVARRRLFHRPTVNGDPNLPAGEGFTTPFGDITYSTRGSATDVALVRHHEQVHSWLSPKLAPLRSLRADLAMTAYDRSSLLQYLEEALAETYAQLRVYGLRGLPAGIRFPVTNGYVRVSDVVTEAVLGTITVGGAIFGVYVVTDRLVADRDAGRAGPEGPTP